MRSMQCVGAAARQSAACSYRRWQWRRVPSRHLPGDIKAMWDGAPKCEARSTQKDAAGFAFQASSNSDDDLLLIASHARHSTHALHSGHAAHTGALTFAGGLERSLARRRNLRLDRLQAIADFTLLERLVGTMLGDFILAAGGDRGKFRVGRSCGQSAERDDGESLDGFHDVHLLANYGAHPLRHNASMRRRITIDSSAANAGVEWAVIGSPIAVFFRRK